MKNLKNKNRNKLKELTDSKIDYTNIPATEIDFWEDAAVIYPPKKVAVKLKIDEDLAVWLKELGSDSDTAINNLLRSYFIGAKSLSVK